MRNSTQLGRGLLLLLAVGLVAAFLIGHGSGSSPVRGSGRTKAAGFGPPPGPAVQAHHRTQERRLRRTERRRERRARRAARRHRRQATTVAAVGGIPVSHCSWQTGPGCPSTPPPGSCHLNGPLQDSQCTPGALNPAVTQATIGRTICVAGYTDRVRPPESYTDPLKYRLMSSYGFGARSPSGFELDHLISLELGGAPSDERNLFPEPYNIGLGARQKDTVENSLHDQVCSGAISLASAQHEILDWTRYYHGARNQSSPPAPPPPASSGGGGSGNCDPNYTGACLDPNASDYDCAGGGGDGPKYVQGPIRVVGNDHFGLDGNGDGVACQ